MPLGAGRKIDMAWTEVVKAENTSKVTCKHCSSDISAKVERIKAHLDKCPKRTGVTVNSQNDPSHETDDNFPNGSASQCQPQPSTSADYEQCENPTKKRKLQQQSMSSFSVKTSAAEQMVLDVKVARFFYANNIAFNAANSTAYKDMITALRPGYTGPSRDRIAGELLDLVSEQVDEDLAAEIGDNCSLTLITDGWSSVRNDPIIATSIHTGTKAYLLETTDCGADKKTAEYCAENVKTSLAMCKEKFGQEVSSSFCYIPKYCCIAVFMFAHFQGKLGLVYSLVIYLFNTNLQC